jgi:hypothetical protein
MTSTYWDRVTAGQCVGCGEPHDPRGGVRCASCAKRHSAQQRRYNRKEGYVSITCSVCARQVMTTPLRKTCSTPCAVVRHGTNPNKREMREAAK